MGNSITVAINNWDKFNPRKDLRASSWLRFQNAFFEDPDFFDFDHSEKLFWFYVLANASKKQTGQVTISIAHANRIGGFSFGTIISALKKLEAIQCVQIIEGLEHADVTSTSRGRHTTNEQNTTNTTNADVTNEYDEHATRTRTEHERASRTRVPRVRPVTEGSKIFDAYSKAFTERYGVSPVRNSKTNSQCKQLADRLGEDACEVVRFYLAHNDGWYLKRQHDLGSLLQAAESMHSQWQRGQAVTGVQVRSFEKQSVNMDLLAKVQGGEV